MKLPLTPILRILVALVLLAAAPAAQAKVYALCVGIDRYTAPGATPLHFAQRDAKSVSLLLAGSRNSSVYTLMGRNATKANILKALKSIAAKAKAGDTLVFYYSGHGTSGAVVASDSRTYEGLVMYTEISRIFKSSAARSKMIIADTCHAGSGRIAKSGHETTADDWKKQNIILFMSSRSNELSTENYEVGGGLFTYYLLQGFSGKADTNRDRAVTAYEIFNYVNKNVSAASGSRQHPVMWGSFNPDKVIIKY